MKRWVYPLIPLIVLGSLVVWRIGQKRAESAAQAGMMAARMKAPPVVSLVPAELRDISHTFDVTGTVEAPLSVKIAPKSSGRIEFLEMREGDRVKKGQVLVRIDPSEVEADVRQQQAAVAEAQYRLAQAQMTENPTNVSVSTQIRQQEAGVASAEADYNQVQQNYQAQVAAAQSDVTDAEAKVDSAKASIRSAEANLANAKARYNRVMELYKQGYIAAQDVDDAKAALSVQQANLETANGQLSSATAQKQAAEQQAKIVATKGKADIAAAQAKLTQARASLDYAKANTAQKPAYKASLEALKASVEAARASLRAAQARRADMVLSSPLDGFVTARYADPGAMATPGQPILEVRFIRQVWVTIAVPEEISGKIHIGQPAKVTFDAFKDRIFEGSVIQLNPSADPQSRQFTARVIMNNSDGLIKPGMFARVAVETDRVKDTVVVPREAVEEDGSGSYVVVVDGSGTAHHRPVVTGASDTTYTGIREGLRPGEKVVTMSAFPVKDGQTVRSGGAPKDGHGGPRK